MCGRAACTLDPAAVRKRFDVKGKTKEEEKFKPSYNVCPMTYQPIVCFHDSERELHYMQWGLVPFFMKSMEGHPPINARAESLAEKAMFRSLLGRKRCVVVTEGYYEWLSTGKKKQPYFFRMTGSDVTPMAALYDMWGKDDEEKKFTFVIITTAASPTTEFIHDRMPALLDAAAVDKWLDPSTPAAEALALLRPYAGKLEFYPVSDAVNRVGQSSPEMVQPLAPKPEPKADGGLLRFFAVKPKEEKVDVKSEGSPAISASVSPSRSQQSFASPPTHSSQSSLPDSFLLPKVKKESSVERASLTPKRMSQPSEAARKRVKTDSAHDDSVVAAVCDMGYSAEQVSLALSALRTEHQLFNSQPSAEHVVNWLLEHGDQIAQAAEDTTEAGVKPEGLEPNESLAENRTDTGRAATVVLSSDEEETKPRRRKRQIK